jgi:hypothetical protein
MRSPAMLACTLHWPAINAYSTFGFGKTQKITATTRTFKPPAAGSAEAGARVGSIR